MTHDDSSAEAARPEMVDVVTAWDRALDDFEATLRRCEQMLEYDDEAPPLAAFEPPALEGPLPGELAARAKHLLSHATELTARLQTEQGRIRDDLARLPRKRSDRTAATARFEAHA
jgi:hypothetical protein